MTTTHDLLPMTRKSRALALWLQNPVALKELRSRMRGRRAFAVLTSYLLLMSVLVALVYLSIYLRAQTSSALDLNEAGKAIFTTVLVVQAFLVLLVGPVFTVGSITGEKERQTFDLLRTTLLSTPALLLGKLISGLAYILLLILAAVPVQSIAFLLGGVTLSDLVLTHAVILICAIAFATLGLFYSSLMRTTLTATVMTLVTVLLTIIGGPLVLIMADMFSVPFYRYLPYNGELFLATTNAAGALVNILDGYNSFGRVSPTLAFVGLYAGISLILFALTVRRLNRPAQI